jgi:hypothetical protein
MVSTTLLWLIFRPTCPSAAGARNAVAATGLLRHAGAMQGLGTTDFIGSVPVSLYHGV